MISRRKAVALLGTLASAPLLSGAARRRNLLVAAHEEQQGAPSLAPGAPTSPERRALVDAFRRDAAGLEAKFEAHTAQGSWAMPYRLFRPTGTGPHPLVIYLHGSGGLGTDNKKQLATGNLFGTHLWALPETQRRYPCFVLAPQTDRGWAKYGDPAPGDSVAQVVEGVGDGVETAMRIVDRLMTELPIDARRIYVTGQSMGGLGVWNMLAHRPRFFAAAVTCCGSAGRDAMSALTRIPIWNFHGDADATVPVKVSRDRIAALRVAGGQPYHTEYAGVGHNVWELAFTEPALPGWMFGQQRPG